MAIETLQEKLVHELGSMYDAEQRFLEAQQLMLQQASDEQLQAMLQQHIEESQGQIRNLEQVFTLVGMQPESIKCDAANGLVIEGSKLMQQDAANPAVLNCVIAGAQAKVEHFEIACYRGLINGARHMGLNQVEQLLTQNLQQEERTAQLIEQSEPLLLTAAEQQTPAVSATV